MVQTEFSPMSLVFLRGSLNMGRTKTIVTESERRSANSSGATRLGLGKQSELRGGSSAELQTPGAELQIRSSCSYLLTSRWTAGEEGGGVARRCPSPCGGLMPVGGANDAVAAAVTAPVA